MLNSSQNRKDVLFVCFLLKHVTVGKYSAQSGFDYGRHVEVNREVLVILFVLTSLLRFGIIDNMMKIIEEYLSRC